VGVSFDKQLKGTKLTNLSQASQSENVYFTSESFAIVTQKKKNHYHQRALKHLMMAHKGIQNSRTAGLHWIDVCNIPTP
jgi:hypothetical protein